MKQPCLAIVSILFVHLLVPAASAQTAANTLDRIIVPPTAPQFGGTIGNTYKDSVPDRLRSADRPESVYTGESRV